MQINLNGQTLRLDAPLTVAQLLERQGMSGKRIAVERNGEIVPRGKHAETSAVAEPEPLVLDPKS